MAAKPEEMALYLGLRSWRLPDVRAIAEEAARLDVPKKRAMRWVEKWSARGWWEYGVSLRCGWFTREAPPSLPPQGKE